MAGKSSNILDDTFEILEVDPDGKKFDKVSRVRGHSDFFGMDMLLDINVDIYPVKVGQKYKLMLASTLNLDGSSMAGHYDKKLSNASASLMDEYEYVMHGKVFKYADRQSGGQTKVEVTISFGGLLLQLTGDPQKLDALELDANVFLLMKHV